ncbi:MAG: hypothetical protein MUF31_16520 [Akkermansiaceae bacterium]|jgi:hypothetical protein|nr:hypothetical protein [Akkermansiaceae bacterium]
MSRHLLFLPLYLLTSFAFAAEMSAVDGMPRVEDQTGLWWVDGPPTMLGRAKRKKEEVLGFQFGKETMFFDTQRVRPMGCEWECAMIAEGRRYVCKGRMQPDDEWQQPVRFVESGRFFQRVVIEGLTFADAEGKAFGGTARLEISVWPDRLAFRLESESEAVMELRHGGKAASGKHSVLLEVIAGASKAAVESELPVTRDEALGCHRLALPEEAWSNAGGTYYPEEHLDRIDRWRVTLRNDSDEPTVARLMFTQEKHLPITGFTPMLCEPDGTPTGLPVQISKNWHIRAEKGRLPHDGQWFHGFAWVRLPARSRRELVFQMVYARYGGVCAASHAQLSLIGWGHNQFWDQVAVGSFGESICFEPGRVQRRCFITDVRPLMTLPVEAHAKPWGWAGNGGGGDFLMWKDGHGRYREMKGTRTEYRAQGPCLTDVGYSEESCGGEISAFMDVSVPAVNDHLRAFVRLRYDVRKPMRWQRLAFFQLGADFYNDVPARRVAIGDVTGLRDEWEPRRAKDEFDRTALPLAGEDAWVSVHGAERDVLKQGQAAATRGLVLRSWRAVLGAKPALPHLATFCTEWGKDNHRTVVELAPPPGIRELLPGDFVEAELELIVFPADAAAYYGPDARFREMLSRDADTWRPVHREAQGNGPEVIVQRGQIQNRYPLVITADDDPRAKVTMKGGLGHVPVTFANLKSPGGHRVLVNGRKLKHWQTDWSAGTQRWQIVCNVDTSEAREVELVLEPHVNDGDE